MVIRELKSIKCISMTSWLKRHWYSHPNIEPALFVRKGYKSISTAKGQDGMSTVIVIKVSIAVNLIAKIIMVRVSVIEND